MAPRIVNQDISRATSQPTTLGGLRPKMRLDGTISSIEIFGILVDVGEGLDCLVHISELNDKTDDNGGDSLEVGQEIDVYILKVDRETLKIALSLRRLSPEPWEGIGDRFKIRQIVNGLTLIHI